MFKKIIIFFLLIFLVWRIFISLSAYFGSLVLPFKPTFPYVDIALKYSKNILIWPWANFDGEHYLYIAEKAYAGFEQAFFPLYPLLIKVLSPLFLGNRLISALFISHSSLICCLILLHKLARLDFNDNIGKWTILFLVFFPTSFFFGSVYTESLFLMLITLSFYGARTNRWWLAGVSGMLASATRLVGIFLLPALIIEYYWNFQFSIFNFRKKTRNTWTYFQSNLNNRIFKKKKNIKNLFWLFLIPLGLLSYMYYLWRSTGDPLMFIHSQPAFGANRSGGEIIFLPQVLFRYLKIIIYSQHNFQYFISILELTITLLFLALTIYGFSKLRLSYMTFSLLCLIGPTLTGTLSSMPRYVLTTFPCFILLGMIKSKLLKFLLLTFCFIVLAVLTICFTRGLFVS